MISYINSIILAPVVFFTLALSVAAPPELAGNAAQSPAKTAVIRGYIGGESHDAYMFSAGEGERMTVTITSYASRASFTITRSGDFSSAEPLTFGRETKVRGGTRWTGKITESGNYYIYVVAHPAARYTLQVKIE